jgi:hypothetical protein
MHSRNSATILLEGTIHTATVRKVLETCAVPHILELESASDAFAAYILEI